jgi:hypothetical protein
MENGYTFLTDSETTAFPSSRNVSEAGKYTNAAVCVIIGLYEQYNEERDDAGGSVSKNGLCPDLADEAGRTVHAGIPASPGTMFVS